LNIKYAALFNIQQILPGNVREITASYQFGVNMFLKKVNLSVLLNLLNQFTWGS
jgi:hypothetical protein